MARLYRRLLGAGACIVSGSIVALVMTRRLTGMLVQDADVTTNTSVTFPLPKPNIQAECPPEAPTLSDLFFHQGGPGALPWNISHAKIAPLCRPPTPLFIAFASRSCLLQQTVLSFVAEGWPASDIVVIDNTGDSYLNLHGLNSDTHTSLNYTLYLHDYGVNVYRSPARQSFSQLQNLIMELARVMGYENFYTSHQDVVVRSRDTSVYDLIIEENNYLTSQSLTGEINWALTFFHYDWLSHFNLYAVEHVGLWDVLIPWYPADCDYYSRVRRSGYSIIDYTIGEIYDVASCVSDISALFSPSPEGLDIELNEMAILKKQNWRGRNIWQGLDKDGSRSPDFGPAYNELVEAGRRNYRRKWRTLKCDVSDPTRRSMWSGWWRPS